MNRITSCALIAGSALLAACAGTTMPVQGGKPEYMLVGVDNKVTWTMRASSSCCRRAGTP